MDFLTTYTSDDSLESNEGQLVHSMFCGSSGFDLDADFAVEPQHAENEVRDIVTAEKDLVKEEHYRLFTAECQKSQLSAVTREKITEIVSVLVNCR